MSIIVSEHLQFMRSNKINVEHDLRTLPSFYWLPKLHKQPYGARFIAASNKCSTKPLSKIHVLTACVSQLSLILSSTAMEFTLGLESTASGSSTIPSRFLPP